MNAYKKTLLYRMLSAFVAFTFTFSLITPPVQAQQTILNLPVPGTMLPLSNAYMPTLVRGMTLYPDNPLQFDFLIDHGDEGLKGKIFEEESKKLIKYFLATLTTPEDELWVNLSPYEKDRIIPEGLDETELGRDLLAQDYILKQLTASLMYPENDLGQKFWDQVYTKANEQFGTTEIPINTFNKVWIVPSKAVVYEHEQNVFILENHLKVMLEEDYVALQNNMGVEKYGLGSLPQDDTEVISGVSSNVVREVLIPAIEKEVNEGKNFANLRQIYNSMLLATWYKRNLQKSLLGQVYVDQKKTKGVDVEDKEIKQKIYDQYLKAFKKGVYDYIREDFDPSTQQIIPRKYFSGGTPGYYVAGKKVPIETKRTGDISNSPVTEGSKIEAVGTTFVENSTEKDIEVAASSSIEDSIREVMSLLITKTIEQISSGKVDKRIVPSGKYTQGILMGKARDIDFKEGTLFDFLFDLNAKTIGEKALELALSKESFGGDKEKIRSVYAEAIYELRKNEGIDQLTPPQLGSVIYTVITHLTGDRDPHSEVDAITVEAFESIAEELRQNIGLAEFQEQIEGNWKDILFKAFVYRALAGATDITFFGLKKPVEAIVGELGAETTDVNFNDETDVGAYLDQLAKTHNVAFSESDIIPAKLLKLAISIVGNPLSYGKIQGKGDFYEWADQIEQNKDKPVMIRVDDKEEFEIEKLKVETLLLAGFQVIIVGAENPVMNDATRSWLIERVEKNENLKKFYDQENLQIISTGTGIGGTDLANTGQEFNDAVMRSGTIIAEGSTNTESLIQKNLTLPVSVINVNMSGKEGIKIEFTIKMDSSTVDSVNEDNNSEVMKKLREAQKIFEEKIKINIPGYIPQRPFDKAIRDYILDMIVQNYDEVPIWMVLDEDTWQEFLAAKLFEEFEELNSMQRRVGEAKAETLIEEGLDILEIIDGINHIQKWFGQDFEKFLRQKNNSVNKADLPSETDLLEKISKEIMQVANLERDQREASLERIVGLIVQLVHQQGVDFDEVIERKAKKKSANGGFERRLYYVGKLYDKGGLNAFQNLGSSVRNNPFARQVTLEIGGISIDSLVYAGESIVESNFAANPSFDVESYLKVFPRNRVDKVVVKKILKQGEGQKFLEILGGKNKKEAFTRIVQMIKEESEITTTTSNTEDKKIDIDLKQITLTNDGRENFLNLLTLLFQSQPGVTVPYIVGDIFGKAEIVQKVVEQFASSSVDVGGINLNPATLDLQIKRDANWVPLPMDQQPIFNMKIDGFSPVIINVTPVNVPLLLGLNNAACPDDGSGNANCSDSVMPMIKPGEEAVLSKS